MTTDPYRPGLTCGEWSRQRRWEKRSGDNTDQPAHDRQHHTRFSHDGGSVYHYMCMCPVVTSVDVRTLDNNAPWIGLEVEAFECL